MMCTDSSVTVARVTLTYLHARIGARVCMELLAVRFEHRNPVAL
jgi:hypothetical protein